MRLFSWELERSARLREDIIAMVDSTLEIGVIHVSLTEDSELTEFERGLRKEGGAKICDAHDGQQHLIAMWLMLAAMHNTVDEADLAKREDEGRELRKTIAERITPKRHCLQRPRIPRIKIAESDGTFLKGLVATNEDERAAPAGKKQ